MKPYPTANVTTVPADFDGDKPALLVEVVWSGVELDRPNVGGFRMKMNHSVLAYRLAKSINAGAVYEKIEVKRDVNGKSYVQASSKVMGRHLHSDLKRLGF